MVYAGLKLIFLKMFDDFRFFHHIWRWKCFYRFGMGIRIRHLNCLVHIGKKAALGCKLQALLQRGAERGEAW